MRAQIHPVFFWVWSTLLVTALIRLDESLFSLAAIASALILVKSKPESAIRLSAFSLAIRLAVIAVVIRMFFALLIGVPMPGSVLFRLPQIDLPEFLVGIRLGGDVTTSRLTSAFSEVILFAALIVLFGVANSLTTPTKILKVIPQKLYGVGVATTLATTLTPQFASSILRIKQAQFLRGQDQSGFRSWRRIGTPVLENALSRSLDLSAALEARGYGINRKPSSYRPVKWDARHFVALLPALYSALVLPHLSIWHPLIALILIGAVFTPAVLR